MYIKRLKRSFYHAFYLFWEAKVLRLDIAQMDRILEHDLQLLEQLHDGESQLGSLGPPGKACPFYTEGKILLLLNSVLRSWTNLMRIMLQIENWCSPAPIGTHESTCIISTFLWPKTVMQSRSRII
jgi:hypothetical protein